MKLRFTLLAGVVATLLASLPGCGQAERTVMGPVRLLEMRTEIPAGAFVCRDAPARPDYFDGLELSDWINDLWHARLDCAAKLKAAGEMIRREGE